MWNVTPIVHIVLFYDTIIVVNILIRRMYS
jgi:hypothetical protein